MFYQVNFYNLFDCLMIKLSLLNLFRILKFILGGIEVAVDDEAGELEHDTLFG